VSNVRELLEEYVNMRENGMRSKDALGTLNHYIAPLTKDTKESLAKEMREWEQQSQGEPGNTDSKKQMERPKEATWVTCPTCDQKNRSDAVFCYSCGLMLDILEQTGTKHFTDSLGQDQNYFGAESVLVLRASETNHEYELRPQNSEGKLFIGRSSDKNAIIPDIDLAEAGGERLGVSRLHLSIKYSPDGEVIQVADIGSINGTLINGRKLRTKEIKVLQDSDELQLGKLILWANFYHPGNELN
jgi:hypothetical protein